MMKKIRLCGTTKKPHVLLGKGEGKQLFHRGMDGVSKRTARPLGQRAEDMPLMPVILDRRKR